MLNEDEELERLRPALKGQKPLLLADMAEAWNDIRRALERNRQTSFQFHPTRRKFSRTWRKRLIAKERRLLREIEDTT